MEPHIVIAVCVNHTLTQKHQSWTFCSFCEHLMWSVKLSQTPICCTCGSCTQSNHFFYCLLMILFVCHSSTVRTNSCSLDCWADWRPPTCLTQTVVLSSHRNCCSICFCLSSWLARLTTDYLRVGVGQIICKSDPCGNSSTCIEFHNKQAMAIFWELQVCVFPGPHIHISHARTAKVEHHRTNI